MTDRSTKREMNRRGFLKRSVVVGSGVAALRYTQDKQAALGARRAGGESRSANEKLNIAFVGSGGQAGFSLKALADQNIVALCDVDQHRAANAFKANPKAAKFRDFRRMLDRMDKQIDAVVVCTPDHMHAPASIRAMRMGKHVYCEKPLTWCIAEARLMAQEAKKNKVATQMGTQGMAEDRSRAGVEVVRSGVIGPVREMHVWTDRAKGWWPQGVGRPKDTPAVPKSLAWDLWLGVAPSRPYHPIYVPFKWRGRKDFGTGAIGDMGIHNAAMPWLGLKLGLPTVIEPVKTSGLNDETFPLWSILRLEFPARGDLPAVTMHWYDGGKKPPAKLIGGKKVASNGTILVGSKGTLYSTGWTGGGWTLLPGDKFRDHKPPAPTLRRTTGHHTEWLAARRGGPPTLCHFTDLAPPLTEVMLLGCLAQRVGKRIEWDAAAMKATNCPEAAAFIKRDYRKGWQI